MSVRPPKKIFRFGPSPKGYARALPDLKRLNEVFRYDRKTGELYWRKKINPAVKMGEPISKKQKEKNRQTFVRLDGVLWHMPRIIWKMCTGKDPGSMEIDHIDRDRTNNRFKNLRLATRSMNVLNVDKEQKARKCGIASKRRWREWRRNRGQKTTPHRNIKSSKLRA